MFEDNSCGGIQSTILADTGASSIVVQTLTPGAPAPSHSQLYKPVPWEDIGSVHQTQVISKSIADTKTFVTYHRDEETGGLIETSVSPNTNHVSARSINSPQDFHRAFSKNDDKPKLPIRKGYSYVSEINRDDDARDASFMVRRESSTSGKGRRHYTVVQTSSNDAVSDTEIAQGNHRLPGKEYFIRENRVSEDDYLRVQRSLSGSSQKQRAAEKHRKYLASSRSTYSLDGGFSAGEEQAAHRVRLLPSGRREQRTKREYLIPRYHSVDSSRPMYVSTEYQDAFPDVDYLEDHQGNLRDVVYAGKDGQLYVRNRKGNYPREDDYLLYPLTEQYGGIEKNNGSDNVDSDVLSVVNTSEEEAFLIGNHKVKKYSKINRKGSRAGRTVALIEGDFMHTVPIYSHKNRRSESPVLRKQYGKSHDRKRRHFSGIRVIPTNYSNDDNEKDEDGDSDESNNTFYTTTAKNKLRQRKPDTLLGNVPPINTAFTNENNVTPYSFGTISPLSSFNTNFALYPGQELSMGFTNPYLNFPYSVTSGPIDLLRNSSLNMVAMKSYVDAMSTSLANIPASTIGASPYTSQQPLEQHGLDTLDNVEAQDFFRNANSMNVDVKSAEIPVLQTHSRSETQQTYKEVSYTDDGDYTSPNSSSPRANHFSSPEDWKDRTQEQYNRQDSGQGVYSRNGTNLKVGTSEKNKSSSNADENNGQEDAMHYATHSRNGKQNLMDRQISKQYNYQLKPKEKNLKHSAVQTDFYGNSPPPRIPTPPQAPLVKHSFAHLISTAHKSLRTRATSRDAQTPTVTTPPPAALPKPKITPKTLTSPELRSLSHKISSPIFSNKTRSSSPEAHDLNNDANDQSPSSTFFAITNLTVIESPEKMDNDNKSGIKKNPVKTRAEKYTALACGTGDKYSITQVSSPLSTHLSTSTHPEADYDVYPRKPHSAHNTKIKEAANGYNQSLISPTNINPEPIKSLHQLDNSANRQIKKYTSNSPPWSSQKPRSSLVSAHESFKRSLEMFESRFVSPEEYKKAANTPPQAPEYQTNKFKAKSESYTSPGLAIETSAHSVKSADEGNRPPRTAKASEVLSSATWSEMQQSQKIEEADTDIGDIPYQFYTGDPSLSISKNKGTHMSSSSVQSPSDNMAQFTSPETDQNESKEFDSDSSNTGYIFYKGPDAVEIVPKQFTMSVLDQTPQTTLDAETENIIKDTEDPASNLDNKNTLVNKFPDSRSVNSGIPIPPRDFESDADNSEYIYTSRGWSHVLDTPNISKVMYCTGVEDNSAIYMDQMFRCSLKEINQTESIMDRFFRDCLPKCKNRSSLINMDFPKTTQLFDRPFRRQLSTSTLSLKWNSDMDLAQAPEVGKNTPFDAIAQHRPRSLESTDLDSGVSLASQNSRDQFDSNDSDNSLIPIADYSINDSDLSASSMELGWDYLSCNESTKKSTV